MSFVQFSFFKSVMSQNAEGVIVEHSNLNPMSTLWKRIQSFVILSHKLNKYVKLTKIAMVQVLLRLKP
jgi:hypothetical protein